MATRDQDRDCGSGLGPGPTDDVISAVAERIAAVDQRRALRRALEVGQVIVEDLFGGQADRVHTRSWVLLRDLALRAGRNLRLVSAAPWSHV